MDNVWALSRVSPERQNEDPWTYVEVAQPDYSEAHERASAILDRVTQVISEIKKFFGLEVFFRREPAAQEIPQLLEAVRMLCNQEGRGEEELPDGLGALFLNQTPPGQITVDDHGDVVRPRIGKARAIAGTNEPHRHIAVRMPYSDERAEAFLTSKARQLPTGTPGLIMIGMGRAPGGFKSWDSLLRRRFQPDIHTRVSAICLFGGGQVTTGAGEAILEETKVLLNPHAATSLPTWIQNTLIEAGSEYTRAVNPDA